MLEPIPFWGMIEVDLQVKTYAGNKANYIREDMNNEPVALTQGDILGILQDANSVPLGQPIFNSSEEYNKLKAIIESAIRYTHPAKELTDEEIIKTMVQFDVYSSDDHCLIEAGRAILRKAQEK